MSALITIFYRLVSLGLLYGMIERIINLRLLVFINTGEPLPPTTPPPTTTPDPTTTVRTTLRSTTLRRRYPEKPENVVATPLSDTEIELTWSPPSVPNGKILEYTCYYAELGKDGKPHIYTCSLQFAILDHCLFTMTSLVNQFSFVISFLFSS